MTVSTAARRHKPARLNTRTAGFCLTALSLALLSACSVTPVQYSQEEQEALAVADLQKLFVEQEAIAAPLTLEDALARSLAYNLDHRLMLMEETLRSDQLHLSRFDMLPELALNSGYNVRSNENLSISRDTQTGFLTANPFLSQDRNIAYANLRLTWNILDFGVSYYQARQNADQILIAYERRRRVINQVVQQVRTSYWRAATAEPLYRQVVPILAEARQALADAQEVEAQRLTPPLESLQYQKGLVEVIRELEGLERDLAVAKTELAALMGLAPGTAYSLALPPAEEMRVPELAMGLEEMEMMALVKRPELIEEHYQSRISALETRKALLRQFPGLSLTASDNYDSNSYLVNQSWAEAGLQLTWSLLNLASGPAALRAARTGEQVAELRRLALSMAALTQVHLGYQQFLRASNDYEQARLLDDIERRIFTNISQAGNQTQTPLQQIRARLAAIYAEVNRYRAFAEVHSAVANLYVSIGLDLLPQAEDGSLGLRAAISPALLLEREEGEAAAPVPPGPLPAGSRAEAGAVSVPPVAVGEGETVRESDSAQADSAALDAGAAERAARLQAFVQAWLRAWESADAAAYFSHYHEAFSPLYHDSRETWRFARQARILAPAWIDISFDGFEVVAEGGGKATVRFRMHYNSPDYEDETRKELRLRELNGGWRIVIERNLKTRVLRA